MSKEKLNSLMGEIQEAVSRSQDITAGARSIVDTDFLAGSIGTVEFSEPIICSLDESIQSCCGRLKNNSTGCVLVEDKEGKVRGIFTERDFITRVYDTNLDFENVAVSEVMTPDPTMVFPDDSIGYCLTLMSMGGFRHLPIIDREALPVGVLSMQDVVKGISERILSLFAN